MCHPQPVAGRGRIPEDGALAAAAYAAGRCLMLDLLARLIIEPDDSETEAELRSFLNTRASVVRVARQNLIADLPTAPAPDGRLELVAGTGPGEPR